MSTKKESATLVTFLLDRTGSMERIKDDTIGAFNAYLEGLKSEKDAEIDFTLLTFDSVSLDKVCVAVPVKDAPLLSKDNYQPRAWTPLIDASVKTIRAVEDQLNGKNNVKVVICIQTDGNENSSREHTWDQLNDLIREKTALGWQFNFMGASIDAYKQAGRMGISSGSTLSYNSRDPVATTIAFVASARGTRDFVAGRAATTNFLSSERLAAGDMFYPKQPDVAGQVTPLRSGPFSKPNTFNNPIPKKGWATPKIVDDFKL